MPQSPTATAAPRPKRRRLATRKATLFEAALQALQQKNILDLTVDDIVQRAGVARGTFYLYFEDKFALLREMAETMVESQVTEGEHLGEGAPTKLAELEARALFAIRRWQANAPVYRSVFQLAMLREDFHALRDRLQIPLRETEAATIAGDLKAGLTRADIDPRVVAACKARMYELLVMEWFGWGSPPYSGATPEEVAGQLAKIWYHAIYPDSCAVDEAPSAAMIPVEQGAGE